MTPPDNEIWYTTNDGNVVNPTHPDAFGVNIVSNTYENGKGVITFDGTITTLGEGSLAFLNFETLTFPDTTRILKPSLRLF